MNQFIILIALFSLSNAGLLLPRDFEMIMPKVQANADIQVVTSCNKVTAKDLSDQFSDKQIIYAGYLNTIQQGSSSLAFIFYGSQKASSEADLSKYPTIIWLQGGPGSSSQLGNYMEFGPILFGIDGKQTANKNSWNIEYNLMFIDQPIGAGYGYAEKPEDIPKNQDQVADQFLFALNEFFVGKNGCIAKGLIASLKTSSWFLFGESYAGKYVPAIAEQWIKKDKFTAVDLKGIGIGDGFTDPYNVMAEMPGFGYNLGLIDYQERQKADFFALTGAMRIRDSDWLGAQQSFGELCNLIVTQSGGMNIYNIFVEGTYSAQQKTMSDFLNLEKTKTTLGFSKDIQFDASNQNVYAALSTDFMQRDCVGRLENVLQAKLPVLIYNGQNDLIVPNPATLRTVNSLKWDGILEFNNKDMTVWMIGDDYAGYQKSSANLELRIVNKAGHLVPMDQGAVALNMVNSFVGSHN